MVPYFSSFNHWFHIFTFLERPSQTNISSFHFRRTKKTHQVNCWPRQKIRPILECHLLLRVKIKQAITVIFSNLIIHGINASKGSFHIKSPNGLLFQNLRKNRALDWANHNIWTSPICRNKVSLTRRKTQKFKFDIIFMFWVNFGCWPFDLKIDPVDQDIKCWWPLDITTLYVSCNISKYAISNIFCFWEIK